MGIPWLEDLEQEVQGNQRNLEQIMEEEKTWKTRLVICREFRQVFISSDMWGKGPQMDYREQSLEVIQKQEEFLSQIDTEWETLQLMGHWAGVEQYTQQIFASKIEHN